MSVRTCPLVALALLATACGPTAPMTTATAGDTSTGDTSTGDTSTGDTTTDPGDSPTEATTAISTTTTTTVDPTTGGSSGDTTFTFIMTPDMGGPDCVRTVAKECDTWTQDCPEGEKCSPYDASCDNVWESNKCVPLDPDPDHPGEPCTVKDRVGSGEDSCDLDSMCWHLDAKTLTGTCVARCAGVPDLPICPDGTTCAITHDGVLQLCLPTCDPLAQDCPDGDLCVPNASDPDAFLCLPDASGDEGQAFDPCDDPDTCDAGLVCADPAQASECDPMALGCCLPFCDQAMPACPGAMQQCLPWNWMDPPPPGLENLGLCAIPQ